MSAPRFGPAVSDGIAALRSANGAHGANQFNAGFRQNQANFVARQVEMYGAATVAAILDRFPILKESI